jgi:predicted RNase H-like HicB family nuclease
VKVRDVLELLADDGREVVTKRGNRRQLKQEGGLPSSYTAWSPDLPGCVATGASPEDVEREMRAAIALQLEGIVEDSGQIREPSGPGVHVARKSRGAA